MGLVPVQDIEVRTRTGKRLRIMLRKESVGFSISLQEYITDGQYAGCYAEFSSPAFSFQDASIAFEYAIKALQLFLTYAKDEIVALNNPCNCELLPGHQQTNILSDVGLPITPTINK